MEVPEKRRFDDVEAANADQNSGPPPSYGGTDGRESEPPTYQQATDAEIHFYDALSEPPPTYQSLFGDIKEARQSANSVFDFLKKLIFLLISTIGCTIAIGIVMAIPIAMIVIGAKYKDECQIEKNIPIYLIVGGSFGIFRNLVSLCQRSRKHGSEEEESRRSPLESVLDCFLLAWFIAGNVWIYSNYKPVFDPYTKQPSLYCHKTLYLFAFWLTNATYILMGVTCLCLCCAGICAAVAT